MSIGGKRTISTSESSDYDVSDLLSMVAKEDSPLRHLGCNDDVLQDECVDQEQKAQISLRERRRNRVQGIPSTINGRLNVRRSSGAGIILPAPQPPSTNNSTRWKQLWKRAMVKATTSGDPWACEGFGALPVEVATRYRFDTRNRKWVVDQVQVKMQQKPFGRGAMRECYRLKKKSNFATRSHDFSTASNCVAKRYLDPAVTRQTYFDDVYLQMDAKDWAERFNLNDPDPPKKIDLIQVAILEFTHRPGSPLYHLEHFIEGEYIKYNSNSGFIDAHARMTPQAFSHFTFERSLHRLMVVDVQGVGDLYTDPQIHTAYTSDMYGADEAPPYGDGNLGVRGMALFCYTHRCNQICSLLGLTPFGLSQYEKGAAAQRWRSFSASGVTQGQPMSPCANGAESPLGATVVRHRTRTRSGSSWSSDEAIGESCSSTSSSPLSCSSACSAVPSGAIFPIHEDSNEGPVRRHASEPGTKPSIHSSTRGSAKSSIGDSGNEIEKGEETTRQTRKRIESQMLPDDADTLLAGIMDPLDADSERFPMHFTADEILALVHLDFARCYDTGRFNTVDQVMLAAVGATPVDSVLLRTSEGAAYDCHGRQAEMEINNEVCLSRDDCESVLFHLREAAKLHSRDAARLLSRIYLNLEREMLNCISDAPFANELFNVDLGLIYMRIAAEHELYAALFLAELYETGKSTKSPLADCVAKRNLLEAIKYYTKAAELYDGDDGQQAPLAVYEVQAKLAALFATDEVHDYSQAYDYYSAAAESATAAMKGKLASRYYELAEEMSGMIEE